METPRPPIGRNHRFSFFYLLLAFVQIISISKCQDALVGTSASGSSCTPECRPGFECILGECQRQQCVSDCSGAEKRTICGSNGQTYYSLCELEKAKCELTHEIEILYDGICITLPPAPAPLCRTHQQEYDEFSNTFQHFQQCIIVGLAKLNNGSLTLDDALDCYKPQCDPHNDDYLIKQCSVIFHDHCWCSTPNGYPIDGTFQKGMPADYCINRQKCQVNGSVYDDGEIFHPSNGCGLCECLDGNYTCFVEYSIAAGSDISDEDKNNFINELMQIFIYQSNYGDHIQADIRHIRKFHIDVTDLKKESILRWKFDHYNRNGDDSLSPSEEFIFLSEVFDFFACPAIYPHLNDLMDTDGDKKISLVEWKAAFGLTAATEEPVTEAQPVKREARSSPLKARKPLHLRKKFRYVLV